MDEDRYFAAIEAVLFATGRAVSKADLARALEISAEEAGKWAASFMEAWNRAPHGTEVVALEDAFQMCTRADYFPELIRLELKPQTPRLTDALLETLSVIAYKQPVTKGEIERIRGVNSDHAVNRLIEYRLVTELGRAKLERQRNFCGFSGCLPGTACRKSARLLRTIFLRRRRTRRVLSYE